MKILEILTDILYYPFESNLYSMQNIQQRQPEILKIIQLSYRLIKHVIREYRPNELYASQWIDIFMKHAMKSDQNNLYVEATLTELVDNNKRILHNKIKNSTIFNFVDMLRNKEKHEKYVNILRALVNCDGEAVISN